MFSTEGSFGLQRFQIASGLGLKSPAIWISKNLDKQSAQLPCKNAKNGSRIVPVSRVKGGPQLVLTMDRRLTGRLRSMLAEIATMTTLESHAHGGFEEELDILWRDELPLWSPCLNF